MTVAKPTLAKMFGRASVGLLPPPYKLFWERLDPPEPSDLPPLLMIPGGAATGASYRMTPDGRRGWADYFQERGHTVYTTDWPGQGRGGYIPSPELSYSFAAEAMASLVHAIGDPRLIVFTHSMSGAVGWKLLEIARDSLAAIVAIGPSPPGNVQPRPVPVGTDPEQASIAGEVISESDQQVHIRFRGNDFHIDYGAHASDVGDYISRLGIGDSKRWKEEWLDVWRSSFLFVPPRLMAERLNYRGAALSIDHDADLSGKRVLIVTGTCDAAHSRNDDGGTAEFLKARGADVQFLWLGDFGILGNGHYLMYEDNSEEIAALIADHLVPVG